MFQGNSLGLSISLANSFCFLGQLSSVIHLCPTLQPHGLQHARPPCPSAESNSRSLLKLKPTESVMPSSIVPFSSRLQSFPASRSFLMSQLFTSGGQSIGASASASVLPNEYSGLFSFRMDWLELLAIQGTLKSPLQHHSSEASILQSSAFLMVQFSHPNMTTGKTIALTR